MQQESTIEFHGGKLNFSAGHFTIFSATEREPLHGHNYFLTVIMTAQEGEPGITFDYRIFKEKLLTLCRKLNWYTLLPTKSPYLAITQDDDYVYAKFADKTLPFLHQDVVLLPLPNITLEELSKWFLAQILEDQPFIKQYQITALQVKVHNGPNQAASANWHVAA